MSHLNATVPLPCPECGYKTQKTVRWIDLHQGSAAMDLASSAKIGNVSASCQGTVIRFQRAGEYRLDCGSTAPVRLKVLRGSASFTKAGSTRKVRGKGSVR